VHGTLLSGFAACMKKGGLGVPVLTGGLTAEAVDRSVASSGDDPPRGTRRQTAGGPPLHRQGERILDRLLGDVDVPELADQDGHCPTVLLAVNTLDL